MGRFVAIEGLDGAGTTTLCARLATRLAGSGREVVATREPTDGPVGRVIRSTLRGEAGAPSRATLPWLFAADRADHLSRVVEPALARGAVVLTDRYFHSSLAYQSLDVDLAEVRALNRSFRVPHLTLFLELPAEAALARIVRRGGEREIFEHRAELERVAASYRTVIDALRAEGQEIAAIDALLPADDVEARAWALMSDLVV